MEEELQRKFPGIGVSPGIALSTAVVYRPSEIDVPTYVVAEEAVEAEWDRLVRAKDVTRRQLRDIIDAFGLEAANGEAGIIDAHLMVLDDEMIEEDLRHEILSRRHNCEWAVQDVSGKYIAKFSAFDDPVFNERAADIADVSKRMLRALLGVCEEHDFAWTEPHIVVAESLTPSETLALPRNFVQGVALDRGSMTSHAALLIRAVGIPAVFGLGNFSRTVVPGTTVGLDGNRGLVVVNPTEDDVAYLRGRAAEREELLVRFRDACREPAVTPDGFAVSCLANIENRADVKYLDANGAEGVGLFRTEYLWLAEGRPVDEATQTRAYADVARAMGDRPLVIRAFDLGGDKFRGGMGLAEREANPFLGMRSIRFLLHNEALFKVQVRAVLRAGAEAGRPIRLLLPMVSDLAEVVRARKVIEECLDDLRDKGVACGAAPRLGIMVEVPSAAILAPILAQHVDFFSIGTNDLTQYTLAADRGNEAVAYLYQPLHPAVLRLVSMAAEAGARAGIDVAVCGEMAGNPLHAVVLLGLRIATFSMAPSSIPLIKALVRRIPLAEAEKVAAAALNSATMAQVRHLSRDLLARYAPEILKQC